MHAHDQSHVPIWWSYAAKQGFILPLMPKISRESQPTILSGKPVADEILEQCKFLQDGRVIPKLAVILVGFDPASELYVNHKIKTFSKIGFLSNLIRIPEENCTSEKLISIITEFNENPEYHGILVQLPLPFFISTPLVLNAISPKKDVDGFSTHHLGQLSAGYFGSSPIACTPFGIMCLLWSYGISLEKKNVVVVGRSLIVGKPMALLALASDATVTITHSKTKDLVEYTRTADVLIVAAGKKHLISLHHLKEGAIVVDVGMHHSGDGKLYGDVDPIVLENVTAMTPVPGGVGPMTIAMLCLNTALSAWQTPT